MKKIFTIFFVGLLTINFSNAQQGDFIVGATSDVSNTNIIFWNLSPTIGYFVSDNICVGMSLGYDSSTDDNNDIKEETDSFGIMPFVRFYQNDKLYYYAGIGISSGSNTYDDDLSNYKSESKMSMFGFMAGVGYSLNWGKHFSFEPTIGIRTGSGSGETEINQNGITADSDFDLPSTFNLGIGLGISLRFPNE